MPLNLKGLPLLHSDMISKGISKTRFEFSFREIDFKVVYIAESFPHTLLIGCQNNNLFIVRNVNNDYSISTYLGDTYNKLIDLLGFKQNMLNPFKPGTFFEIFDKATPCYASKKNIPSMLEIALLSNDVEESDKIYFYHWRNHDGVTSNATPENLEKTKRICGLEAYEACLKHNISSCWTDYPQNAEYHLPGSKN